MTTLLKVFLPVYFLLFFGLAMFWRSYIAWKRTGINPYKLGNGDTVHDFVGKLFRLTLIAAALIVFVFSFLDQLAGQSRIKERVNYMRPSKIEQKNSPLKLSRVEMKLEAVTLEQLANFLYGVETSRNMAVVTHACT